MSGMTAAAPRFKVGDRVVVDDRPSLGHCRTPTFVRGQSGHITAIQGAFRDPERLAYHRPGLPALVLYKVRFRQSDIWPGYTGQAGDQIELDIYDNWLRPGQY
ncbi:MAG: SH3-like domain-containing protein [Hyphomicrobiaceae bacterium]